jgi:SSS family solute:Na+ symporter
MSVISLSPVDWLVIAFYFVAIIGIGIYLRRHTKTGDDFFLAGRRNSSWVAGLAFVSANLGALEILGWTGGTMKYGMAVSHFYWIGAIPAMLFLALFMMPFYYSSRIHSIPGYLLLRFDEKTRLLNAFSFAVMTLLMSGINLYLMALVFRTILGWNWDVCMWISAVTVASYVALGGLTSAIFTEIVQFFLIWFGLFLVAILGLVDLGGLDRVLTELPREMSGLWSTMGSAEDNPMGISWLGIALGLGFVLSFGYWTTDFLIVQRAFSARDLRSARMTPVIAAFFKMALPFIVVVAGLVAYTLAQSGELRLMVENGQPNYDSAMPLLIARYYPHGLIGLGVTALLAGFMAGQAGNISAFNTVWTYDIYRAIFRPKASDAHLVWVGRVTTIVGILLSVATAYWAKQFPTIMDYIQAIFSWVNAPLFATMLLGMFWTRATPTGAFVGLIAGMATSFSIFLGFKLEVIPPDLAQVITLAADPSDMSKNLWQAWWAWLVCFVVTIVISLVTKPVPATKLVGLVWGMTERTVEADVPWLKRPAFWAAIALLVVIGLNLYFW